MNEGVFYASVCEYERAKRGKIEDLLTDADFFVWLDIFTQEYEGFDDGRWKHCHKEISEEDRTNIERINFLYDAIHLWAGRNEIYPKKGEKTEFYEVAIDGIGYEIGVSSVCGFAYFCNRVKIGERFISFRDVFEDRELDNIKQKQEEWKKLEQAVKGLIEIGIPKYAVSEKVEDIIAKVYTKDI